MLAISDVGIAMGGLGSDAAIETADVVIQTDQPSKDVAAINIGKATNNIVWAEHCVCHGCESESYLSWVREALRTYGKP